MLDNYFSMAVRSLVNIDGNKCVRKLEKKLALINLIDEHELRAVHCTQLKHTDLPGKSRDNIRE